MEEPLRVRKIVTHGGNAHMDDLLGTALLAYKYGAPVERVISVDAFEDETIYLDIGRRYEPPYLLDHHQDIEIPCSLVLVVKHHFPELVEALELPEMKFIDVRDRFGLHRAIGVEIPSETLFFERVFTRWFANIQYISPEDEEYQVLRWLGRRFYNYLRERVEEMREIAEALENAVEMTVNGVKILVLDKAVPPYEVMNRRGDVQVIIQPSSRNPEQYSVIKLSRYQDMISLDKVAEKLRERGRLVFYHANKFMLVGSDKESVLESIDGIEVVGDGGDN